ncbi:oxidoreductase [Saccharopolyspora phatthalungensis]|uniref:Aryl-alcohol dehydrogenase-like predicted oxidoreductase n=1 Tax=Saccharopolyspora phatthalungensis TaxID=664693 RepID=A0A840QI52_9PSEU|nr:oxidoreductase [Saccharopolyspora phatthalungensis]MBB5158245.1 aryl-alcohol dehydrogenase-like predicted oxidoreductase [Saccharopolyspora phatthalungensis]
MTNVTAAVGGEFLLGGDLRVNRLGFGAMRLVANSLAGPPRDPATGVAVVRRAVELGVNHIDTAGFYRLGGTQAHEVIREALSPLREDVVIATKVGPMRGADGIFRGQARPADLRGLVEEDLRRLGVPRLDLVYLRPGGLEPDGTSVADRFAVLAELRESGLIRHLGLSNVDAAQFAQARSIAPVVAVQNHFHVRHNADRQVLADCERLGIAYVPFAPLGGGLPVDMAGVRSVARRLSASVAQVSLAWLLAVSPVALAIPGTGSVAHLEDNVAATGLRLGPGDLAELGG